ncbi:MAG TPA: hypothetical protein VFE78_07880 [Gemmataceae bacterium]|jgi:hypothetical protein|nr:hypothetical protein [Gemmataceae bacterium]
MLWEWQRDEALVRQLGLANRCTAAKQAVTAEVVAGRLSLAEAAYRFAEAGEGVDGGTWLGRCPRASSELDASLNVLSWVAFDTENYPGSPEAFSRLLAEYRRQFGEPPAAVSRNWGKALEGCRWQPGP